MYVGGTQFWILYCFRKRLTMNVAYLQIVIVYGLQRVQNFGLSCTATEKNKTFYCIVSEKKNSDTSTYGCTAVTVVGPCTEHIISSLLSCFRKSSGTYECTAVNGVSRPAKAEIQVRVKCKFLTLYDARLLYKLYFE